MMRNLSGQNDRRIAFVDPSVVFKDTMIPDPKNIRPAEMERNIRKFLYNQRDKEYILFPYNMG